MTEETNCAIIKHQNYAIAFVAFITSAVIFISYWFWLIDQHISFYIIFIITLIISNCISLWHLNKLKDIFVNGYALYIGATITIMIMSAIYCNIDRAEMAAWFQAIGSIAAIAFAGLFVTYQIGQNEKQIIDKENKEMKKIFNILDRSHSSFMCFYEEIHNDKNIVSIMSYWQQMKSTITYLNQIDPMFYKNFELCCAILSYIQTQEVFIVFCEDRALNNNTPSLDPPMERIAIIHNQHINYQVACMFVDEESWITYVEEPLSLLNESFENAKKAISL